MKFRHLCPTHARQILCNEHDAQRYWNSMMERGVHAYALCRVEAAEIYLAAAVEVAALRLSTHNEFFDAEQLLKPIEFLLNLYAGTQQEQEALALAKTAKQVAALNPKQLKKIEAWLEPCYRPTVTGESAKDLQIERETSQRRPSLH